MTSNNRAQVLGKPWIELTHSLKRPSSIPCKDSVQGATSENPTIAHWQYILLLLVPISATQRLLHKHVHINPINVRVQVRCWVSQMCRVELRVNWGVIGKNGAPTRERELGRDIDLRVQNGRRVSVDVSEGLLQQLQVSAGASIHSGRQMLL